MNSIFAEYVMGILSSFLLSGQTVGLLALNALFILIKDYNL